MCKRTGVLDALVDAAADRNAQTRDSIFKSVVDIGAKRPNVVLKTCHTYLNKHNKVRADLSLTGMGTISTDLFILCSCPRYTASFS